jgi:hypothetical protein
MAKIVDEVDKMREEVAKVEGGGHENHWQEHDVGA